MNLSRSSSKKSPLDTVKAEHERLSELTRLREESNRPKTYAAYLDEALARARETLGEENASAALKQVRSAPGYGTRGESLARAGLDASGYADYLQKEAELDYGRARAKAEGRYAEAVTQGEAEYEKYLARHEASEDEILRQAIRRMTTDRIEGYDEGYRYAVMSGLSRERAELFARMCDAYGTGEFRTLNLTSRVSLLREIMQNGLDYESAYLYARAVGASGATAKRIAEFAAGVKEPHGDLFGDE